MDHVFVFSHVFWPDASLYTTSLARLGDVL